MSRVPQLTRAGEPSTVHPNSEARRPQRFAPAPGKQDRSKQSSRIAVLASDMTMSNGYGIQRLATGARHDYCPRVPTGVQAKWTGGEQRKGSRSLERRQGSVKSAIEIIVATNVRGTHVGRRATAQSLMRPPSPFGLGRPLVEIKPLRHLLWAGRRPADL
jgi:hypothetical protein